MKILVTGGAGYIGSHFIIETLRNTDWQVISLDNYVNSSPKAIERIKKITEKHVLNHNVDLCDRENLFSLFENNRDIKAVIHFAALKSVPESVQKPLLYYQNNISGLVNLLEATEKSGIHYFIFSSSCSVYGNVTKLPVNESTPIGKAQSPYAHTKQVGEEIVENFSRISNVRAISLRYFNPVGADPSGLNGEDPLNMPNNLVPVITQVASGILPRLTIYGNDYPTRDGTCIRDYIHVSDISIAHIRALEYLLTGKNKKAHEIFNLGTGNGVTVMEAVKAFENVTGVRLNYNTGPRRAGDVEAVYSDNSFTEKTLGWKPLLGIDEMMLSAWKWQQELNKENKQ